MSGPKGPRRADLQMPEARGRTVLEKGYAGRLATVGEDGWPYAVPLLYVCGPETVYVHTGHSIGQLARNLAHEPRVCFVVDEPGSVYGYGRFECDTALSYTSVMVFGLVRAVTDLAEKSLFCSRLMEKYAREVTGRPREFFPRLDAISVYAISIERITGKEIVLPAPLEQWPALDRTLSPRAVPPA